MSWPNLSDYHGIHPEGQRKPQRTGQILNWASLKYKLEALPLEPTVSFTIHILQY